MIALPKKRPYVALISAVIFVVSGAMPLSTVGAPTGSLFAACLLYLLPLWTLLQRTAEQRRTAKTAK